MMPDFPSLPELMSQAAKLPLHEFVKQFPHYYLITECIGTTSGSWNVATEAPAATTEITNFKAGARGLLGVAPVVKREGVNPYAAMITLGRARNNDVAITDISVSKLHAWIRRGDNGSFTTGDFSITDAGSRNGTFVNGVEVLREPHLLPVGAHLRLGLVEFLFVDGIGLHRALRSAPSQTGRDTG
jgi:hypothetical protein